MTANSEFTAEVENINLSAYADPNVEAIMLNAAARGNDVRLHAIKVELQLEQLWGWCYILMMDDDIAIVRWVDQFVLTIKDTSLASPVEGS